MSLHLKRIEAYRLSLLKEEVLEEEEKKIVQEVISESDETASTIKYKYESNADTNAFTDAKETKLSGIATGAEVNNISDVNATDLTDTGDSTLHYHSLDRARADHTGTQLLSTISDSGALAALDTVDTAQIDDGAIDAVKLDAGLSAVNDYVLTYLSFASSKMIWKLNPGDNSHYIRLTLSGTNTFSQTVGSSTAIGWNVETFKDSAYFTHDNTTNPERITFDVAGTYSIQWNLSFTHGSSSSGLFVAAPQYIRYGPSSTQKRGITKSYGNYTYKGTISQYSEITVSVGFYVVMYSYIDTSSVTGTNTIINDESEIIIRKII